MTRPTVRLLIATTLIVITIGLLIMSLSGFLTPIENLFHRPLGGTQSWISLRVAAIRDVLTSPRDVASLREENTRLEAEVALLQQEIIALREQVAEAEILAALLDYARTQPDSRSKAVPVIGRDVSPFLRSVWIGSGSDDGLAFGMPVVTERGLIGRVVEVFPSASRVQLISDPEAAVNVKFQTTRADGILSAQVNGELRVDLIDQSAELNQGELVLTSGLGGKYPADIPIGQVISIRKRDYELFQQAVIQPSVNFDDLDLVLVITNFQAIPTELGAP